ncbi:hypothetical protein [Mesorhizobium sp.]|uniref:hypothetical protein n=1 Tax=Mesorhizobium sp. TaxID=1871066 RepID=UPI0025CC32D8|nr:hypothetical protein [Mesorhizobium sp.]
MEADSRLTAIRTEVEKAYTVSVGFAKGPEWEAQVKGRTAVIRIAETGRPLSSFAHELLHLRLSARGYRHILAGGNIDDQKRLQLIEVLVALDNELQHHRMFPDFIEAGFNGSEFYAESDDRAFIALRKQIKALKLRVSPSAAFLIYLTLIGPGGCWPDGKREDLLKRLQEAVSAEVWTKLEKTKAIIEDWKHRDSLDPASTIVEILKTLGDLGGSMVGDDIETIMQTGAYI